MNIEAMNVLLIVIYRVFTVITPLITSPYIARILGPYNLGLFSFTYAHANYFILLCMLGVEYYGTREISMHIKQDEIKKRFWEIYSVQFLASAGSILLYFFSIIFYEGIVYTVAKWQVFWLFAAMFDVNWFFFALKRFRITVIRNVCIKILNIVLLFYLIKSDKDLIAYSLLMSISLLLSNLVLWPTIINEFGNGLLRYGNFCKNLREMLKLFIPILCLSVFQITDKMMVGLLSDDMNSGCYYLIDKLINMPLSIVMGLGTVMLPKLVYIKQHLATSVFNETVEESYEITVSVSCVIAFGIASVSYEFVPVFFGKGYDLCIPMLIASIPVIIFKSLEEFIRSQYLIPRELDSIYIKGVAYAALVNLICNFF